MFEVKSRAAALPALVLGLSVAFGAAAQTGTTAPPPSGSKAPAAATKAVSTEDVVFLKKAAMGGMAEVELGKLAQQKASNPEVKAFGARMVQDHGKANEQVMQLAGSKGIELPGALDQKHKSDVDRLSKLSGAEFDRAYMRHMVDDHKKDIADFKKASTSAKDADVKAFASKTLPTLQEHLKLAQETQNGISQTVGREKKKGGC